MVISLFFLAKISFLFRLKHTADAKIKPLDSGAIIASISAGIDLDIWFTTYLKAAESFNSGVMSLYKIPSDGKSGMSRM